MESDVQLLSDFTVLSEDINIYTHLHINSYMIGMFEFDRFRFFSIPSFRFPMWSNNDIKQLSCVSF